MLQEMQQDRKPSGGKRWEIRGIEAVEEKHRAAAEDGRRSEDKEDTSVELLTFC